MKRWCVRFGIKSPSRSAVNSKNTQIYRMRDLGCKNSLTIKTGTFKTQSTINIRRYDTLVATPMPVSRSWTNHHICSINLQLFFCKQKNLGLTKSKFVTRIWTHNFLVKGQMLNTTQQNTKLHGTHIHCVSKKPDPCYLLQ